MPAPEELKLRDYLNIIAGSKKLIIWGTLICVLTAALISLILPRVYQSQLILEVGKIYLPPAKDKPTQEVEFIEEPASTAEVLKSEAFLSRVRRELGLEITMEKMRKDLEVVTFPEERGSIKMGSPLVELIYRGNDPRTTVKVLTLLASVVSEEHRKKYEDNIEALKSRVVNLEGKIADFQKVVDQQKAYRQETKKQADLIAQKVSNFENKIGAVNVQQISDVEAMFINSYTSNQERVLSSLNEALVDAEISIGENQEKIGDFKDEIANLSNLANLCQSTRVRSQAVVPEKPIRPKYSLNIVIGGLIGLVLTIGIAFFKEYAG